MSRNCAAASNLIEDAFNIVKKVIVDLPSSTAHESLTKGLKFMGAVNAHLEGTSLATGTAVVAALPVDIPIPKPAAPQCVVKTAYKCAATTLGEVPPEKKKNESDEAFVSRKKYSEKVQKKADRNTKLGEMQCPCSITFDSMEQLLEHQGNAHPDKKVWKCAHCDSVSNSKGHLWTHTHHHLGKYFHYCNCPYTDPKNLDKKVNLRRRFATRVSTRSLESNSIGRCIMGLEDVHADAITATNRSRVYAESSNTMSLALRVQIKMVVLRNGVRKQTAVIPAGLLPL